MTVTASRDRHFFNHFAADERKSQMEGEVTTAMNKQARWPLFNSKNDL
jgi:hypothetical protein